MDMARSNTKANRPAIPDQTLSLVQSMALGMPITYTSSLRFPFDIRTTAQQEHCNKAGTFLRLKQVYGDLPAGVFEPTPIAGNSSITEGTPALQPFLLEDALDEALDAMVEETRSLFKDNSEVFEPPITLFDTLPTSSLDPFQIQADPFNHCKDQLDDGPSLSIASKRPLSHNSTTTTSTQMLKRRRTDGEPSFRCYQEKQWTEQFQELIKFKEQKGHCIVPHTYPENQILSRWAKRQRYQYKLKMAGKASTMTDTRIKMLEDIAFVWDSHAAAWEKRFRELQQYQKDHGDCNVPSSYTENRELVVWIKCQRRQYKLFWSDNKSSSMTLERIQALNEIGFVWKVRY